MRVINDINTLKDILFQLKVEKKTIGLIPTMGALHSGHLSLIHESNKECSITVCSIYVNPTQFNNPSDLKKYPKTIDSDLVLLEKASCDIVFCPEDKAMYANGHHITFDFGKLDKVMEGQYRTGHFSGMATIVSKLFNIVQPDISYFGQKDLQQFTIINELAKNLLFGTEVRCVPIVREENGLALSSRNMRVSAVGKDEALILHRSLEIAKKNLKNGESIDFIKDKINRSFADSMVTLEYFEIVNSNTLEPISSYTDGEPVAVCIAGFIEEVRLIDNVLI
jgi:pantoate--beta-alanine ligase